MPNGTKNRFSKQNCMTTTFECPKRGVMLFSSRMEHRCTVLNQLSHGSAETRSKHFRTHLLHPISVLLNHCGLIRSRSHIPSNIEELKAAVRETWEQITEHDINCHVKHMEERVQAVLEAKGGHTKW